jgi:hypothetical protein
MLDLTRQGREFLHSVNALSSDEGGHEILVGLSFAESHFFLRYQTQNAMAKNISNVLKYKCLADRHLLARRTKISNNHCPGN